MRIYLIGFMGSGKSTFGKRLATKMGYAFLDTDKRIEERSGMTIPELFALSGEPHFRLMEQEVLHETAQLNDVVIACGGGTPCFFDNMDWMRAQGTVVYLKVSEQELFKRLLMQSGKRPLLQGLDDEQLMSYIQSKTEERKPFYDRAHQVIDPTAVNLSFVAEQLLRRNS